MYKLQGKTDASEILTDLKAQAVSRQLKPNFEMLKKYHLAKLIDEKKDEQQISNHGSILNKFMESNGFSPDTPLEEVFNDSKRFIAELDKHLDNYTSKDTKNTHSSSLHRFMESASEFLISKHKARTPYGSRNKKKIILEKACSTPFRKNVSEVRKHVFRLDIEEHAVLAEEFKAIKKFKTSYTRGIKNKSKWKVRPDRRCGTAEAFLNNMQTLFGFAALPQGNDKRKSGLGIPYDELSFAHISDSGNVISFFEFVKARAGFYNTTVEVVGAYVTSLLKEKTGYLWLHPEIFAKKIAKTEEEWQMWCSTNRMELLDFLKEIKDEITKTRNPFEPIMWILQQQHPILVIDDMLKAMEEDMPPSSQQLTRAVHCRDMALVAFLRCEPLRERNVVELTWKPDDSGQLYQTEKKEWAIRLPASGFKNWKYSEKEGRNVILSKSSWKYIDSYIFEARPVLLGRHRSDRAFLNVMTSKAKTIEMTEKTLYQRILNLTRFYIEKSFGFGPQAFRPIAASEYIKNHPEGYEVAARVLHDKVATVKKAYSWLKTQDVYFFWTDYADSVIEDHRNGDPKRSDAKSSLDLRAVETVKRLLTQGYSIEDLARMLKDRPVL